MKFRIIVGPTFAQSQFIILKFIDPAEWHWLVLPTRWVSSPRLDYVKQAIYEVYPNNHFRVIAVGKHFVLDITWNWYVAEPPNDIFILL